MLAHALAGVDLGSMMPHGTRTAACQVHRKGIGCIPLARVPHTLCLDSSTRMRLFVDTALGAEMKTLDQNIPMVPQMDAVTHLLGLGSPEKGKLAHREHEIFLERVRMERSQLEQSWGAQVLEKPGVLV